MTFSNILNVHGFKEDFIVWLTLSSSEKMILYCRNTTSTYKLLDIFLQYDAIFCERYIEQSEWVIWRNNIDYIYQDKVHPSPNPIQKKCYLEDWCYQPVCLLQGLLLLFLDICEDFTSKTKNFASLLPRMF